MQSSSNPSDSELSSAIREAATLDTPPSSEKIKLQLHKLHPNWHLNKSRIKTLMRELGFLEENRDPVSIIDEEKVIEVVKRIRDNNPKAGSGAIIKEIRQFHPDLSLADISIKKVMKKHGLTNVNICTPKSPATNVVQNGNGQVNGKNHPVPNQTQTQIQNDDSQKTQTQTQNISQNQNQNQNQELEIKLLPQLNQQLILLIVLFHNKNKRKVKM